MAYSVVEPWGEERADLRSGVHGAALVNSWAGKEVVKPDDFDYMGQAQKPLKRQSTKRMKRKFHEIVARNNQWQSKAT